MKLEDVLADVEKEMLCLKNEDLNSTADEIVDKINQIGQDEHKIYVYGAGRSGFIGRSFVMRLVQLGLKSHFIGESSTPLMQKDDAVILISGSGQTNIIKHILEVAKRIELYIILITVSQKNHLPDMDIVAAVGGKSKTKTDTTETLPLASYYEINSLIFLESIIAKLIQKYPQLKKNITKFGDSYKKDEVVVL